MKILWVDLETTGTDVVKDRIVQIAIIKTIGFKPVEEFSTLVNPGIPIPTQASDIHGIKDEEVKSAPKFMDISKKLIEMLEDVEYIGGYNSNSFDVPMFYCELERCGIEFDWRKFKYLDGFNVFREKEERTLSAAVQFYLGKPHEGAHDALDDVRATVAVVEEQIQRYALTNEELFDLSGNKDKPVITNNFIYDKDGDVIFNFGTHMGKKISSQPQYLSWMLGKSFHPDVHKFIRKYFEDTRGKKISG